MVDNLEELGPAEGKTTMLYVFLLFYISLLLCATLVCINVKKSFFFLPLTYNILALDLEVVLAVESVTKA